MLESVFYQDILREGRKEEGMALVLRQLVRQIGVVTPELRSRIQSLSLSQLEDLSETLLHFSDSADLVSWLKTH